MKREKMPVDIKNKEKAIANPEKTYTLPEEVVTDNTLQEEEKLKILESWALDQTELACAEEENMSLKSASKLPPEEMLVKIKEAQRLIKGNKTCPR